MTDYFTHPLNPPPQGRGNKIEILRILANLKISVILSEAKYLKAKEILRLFHSRENDK
ncbi:hypothetical protein ACWIUD_05055 [Helicobacter sp. 23-1044]